MPAMNRRSASLLRRITQELAATPPVKAAICARKPDHPIAGSFEARFAACHKVNPRLGLAPALGSPNNPATYHGLDRSQGCITSGGILWETASTFGLRGVFDRILGR
jgi:hypothetical protein